MLLRLAYLGLTNAFALLRLVSMSSRDRDIEILALRHQIAVLQRQLGDTRVRFSPADRALLAALLHRLPHQILHKLRLLVRPETILRWYRDLLRRHHARMSRPKRRADHVPSGLFESWFCAWPKRTRAGATAGSTANSSPWA